MSSFVTGLPYGYDTAFGYTTLIDPKQELKKLAATSNAQEMKKQDFGLNKAELKSIDLLIKGTYSFSLHVIGEGGIRHVFAIDQILSK